MASDCRKKGTYYSCEMYTTGRGRGDKNFSLGLLSRIPKKLTKIASLSENSPATVGKSVPFKCTNVGAAIIFIRGKVRKVKAEDVNDNIIAAASTIRIRRGD